MKNTWELDRKFDKWINKHDRVIEEKLPLQDLVIYNYYFIWYIKYNMFSFGIDANIDTIKYYYITTRHYLYML